MMATKGMGRESWSRLSRASRQEQAEPAPPSLRSRFFRPQRAGVFIDGSPIFRWTRQRLCRWRTSEIETT